jgi:hypothetical protein
MASSGVSADDAAADILRGRGVEVKKAPARKGVEKKAAPAASQASEKKPDPTDDPNYDPNLDPKNPIKSIFYVHKSFRVGVQSAKKVRACKAKPAECEVEAFELRYDTRLVDDRDAVDPFFAVIHYRPAKDGKPNYNYVGGQTFEGVAGKNLVDVNGVEVKALTYGQYYVTMGKLDISWDKMWGSLLAGREAMAALGTGIGVYGLYRLTLFLANPPKRLKLPLIKDPIPFKAYLRTTKLKGPVTWLPNQLIRWHVKDKGFTTLMVFMGEAGLTIGLDRGVNFALDQVHFYEAKRRDWLYRVIPGTWNQVEHNEVFDDTAFQDLSLWNKVRGVDVNGKSATTEQLTGKTPEQIKEELSKVNRVRDVKKLDESMSEIASVFDYFFTEYFVDDTADLK